ncbi:MAG: hypothetical protein QM772_12045 [Ottowia sp.]|uniref:hypothetical protein n=1 Tax=Ottowia sp. TaxID=1898956 RepID=UPI0039E5C41D
MSRTASSKGHLQDFEGLKKHRQISGLIPTEDREVRYIEDKSQEPFDKVFINLVRYINPPLMADGGALIDGCVLVLSSGRRFQAISYRGDIDGWRNQVTQGAAMLNIVIGYLEDGKLVLTDESSYSISECVVEFY